MYITSDYQSKVEKTHNKRLWSPVNLLSMIFVPHGIIAQHGVENGDHLSHTGGERDLFVFSVRE